jgi:hypothetical protein
MFFWIFFEKNQKFSSIMIKKIKFKRKLKQKI